MPVPKPAPSLDLDFDEAVLYFRRHRAVTKDEWDRLDTAARRRAVRVASIAHRGVLNDVWKALEKSVADGADFRQFKADIATTLRKKYGAAAGVPTHLETIYLNETQRAFTHGRVVAALDSDVRTARPFWQFRAIEDTRITPICKECNGTIAEAGGSWWRSHTPPLHHRCRSSFITLTPAEAGRRGGTTSASPRGDPQKGFGEMPSLDDDGADLEAFKAAQLPRELQPQLEVELALPVGPPGHPERPPRPQKPEPPWWPSDGESRVPGQVTREPGVRLEAKEEIIGYEMAARGSNVRYLRPQTEEEGVRTADTRIGRGEPNTNVEFKTLSPSAPSASRSDKTLSDAVVTAARRAWRGNSAQARCVIVDVRPRHVSQAQVEQAARDMKRKYGHNFDFILVLGEGFELTIQGSP